MVTPSVEERLRKFQEEQKDPIGDRLRSFQEGIKPPEERLEEFQQSITPQPVVPPSSGFFNRIGGAIRGGLGRVVGSVPEIPIVGAPIRRALTGDLPVVDPALREGVDIVSASLGGSNIDAFNRLRAGEIDPRNLLENPADIIARQRERSGLVRGLSEAVTPLEVAGVAGAGQQ